MIDGSIRRVVNARQQTEISEARRLILIDRNPAATVGIDWSIEDHSRPHHLADHNNLCLNSMSFTNSNVFHLRLSAVCVLFMFCVYTRVFLCYICHMFCDVLEAQS